ncbi:MAG: cell division protein FtsZ [Lachnospiraceae bacterium]|nr:cell division protein FtsZ [Ruminococcus sp.]MCM1275935.1 cell division protein FtsZ [Lachnospiraceae bacterium]
MAFTIDDNNDGFEVADDFQMTTKIMVFGVGGAGGNAVSHMVESGIHDVEYIIANTDVAALRGKDGSKMRRIQIGRKTTKGQGAGNDPAKGRDSAEENREDIEKAMDGVSMLFIAAGMGGGTGTGAAPVVASVAKEKDILTVGVVTKPFGWEGTSKMRQAIGGISEMKKYVDALIVIPNDRLKELKGAKITLKNAFSEVDNILCKAVMGIIKLLQGDGHINVDFADVKMALSSSGIAHMAIGHGKGDYKIDEALDEVLNSPLLETSINGARRGLLNISVPSTLSFEEFDSLTQDIAEKFNSDARYKFGVVFDDSLAEDEISLIVVATDFEEGGSVASVPGVSVSADPEPVASVTVTPTSEGLSGNVGFASGASDIDLLLQKFNQGRD